VKRTILIQAVVVAIGLGTNPARAQPQQQMPQQFGNQPIQQTAGMGSPSLRPKVAVINLQSVVRQYKKYENFETEYKKMYESYTAQFEAKKAQATDLKSRYEKTVDDQEREALQRQMRALDREVQDWGDSVKKQLAKLRDEQTVQIYREVETAVQVFARANDIEIVLHFNDALTPQDLASPINIMQKLQTRALFPMYVNEGMDITNAIAAMLNQRLNTMSSTAPPAGR
jgi:Skp family chaperone for outer membrane proteins